MPHVVIIVSTNLINSGPVTVGNDYSDPTLMQQLCAHKRGGSYETPWNVHQVLNSLEYSGYHVVAMSSTQYKSMWTLWKPAY